MSHEVEIRPDGTVAVRYGLVSANRQLPIEQAVRLSAKELAWGADGTFQALKARPTMRFTLGLSYPANRPDVKKALDGYRDFATKDEVELACWRFAAKSQEVGCRHQDGTEGRGLVVENYVYRGPDWALTDVRGGEQAIKAGDWLTGIIWEPETWVAIQAGLLNGQSFQGPVGRRSAIPDQLASLRR